jgi:hypothetical protein
LFVGAVKVAAVEFKQLVSSVEVEACVDGAVEVDADKIEAIYFIGQSCSEHC